MLVTNKKHFIWGTLLAISFVVLLIAMFSPVLEGQNSLEAADSLFNSISKGSTHYIPDLLQRSKRYRATNFEAAVRLPDGEMEAKATKLLTQAGIDSSGSGDHLKVKGSLGQLLQTALKDAEAMFNNQGKEIAERYGFPEKEALFVWWKIFKEVEKEFKRQKRFEEATFVADVVKKGVEVGYNFYEIEPQKASAKAGILSFSLVFYVVYTLWWGIAIYFLFEGVGLKMEAGVKKEV